MEKTAALQAQPHLRHMGPVRRTQPQMWSMEMAALAPSLAGPEALEEALGKHGKPEVFNSDQGSQFRHSNRGRDTGTKIFLQRTESGKLIELTVLFSTHNGEQVLPRMLDGYVRQGNPGFEWKLVVVDNGSTDSTAEILTSYRDKLRLHLLNEPTPGKNRALNRGLDWIEGDVIIVTDDDAIPEPGFLITWREAFHRHSAFDVFGGSIIPLFESSPPDWILETQFRFEELYSSRIGVPEGPIHPGGIFGPNMAVRRTAFARGLKFFELIGPNAADTNYAMGSETEFCSRAYRQGFKTWFAPEPTVRHIVRPHQILPDYCAGRAYRFGRGSAQLRWESGLLPNRSHVLLRLAAPTWHLWMRSYLAVRTMRRDDRKRLEARWRYEFYRGFRDEHWRRKKEHAARVVLPKDELSEKD